jgi:transglutaminase-like putative cysteine protease
MKRPQLDWASTLVPSALAGLVTWVSLWAWAGFVQSPSGYLVPTLGAVILVAGSGALLRAARVPALAVLAAQLSLLTLWLTHRWAADLALGGWVPTPESIAASVEVLRDSVAVAQSYAAPVSDSAPAMFPLLIVSGALVAVLVDFIACGLRRVPVAGLPLLALYTAPVSILRDGVPWWVFAAGALAFLALLAADEGRRLMSWGRRVPRSGTVKDSGGGRSVSTASLRDSARKIGLTATGLALVTPLVVPTLTTDLLGGPGPGGDGPGDAVAITNPMVNLRRDLVRGRDVDLIRIRTESADPSYLRISVLDTFDGTAWRPSERDIPRDQQAGGRLPRPPGLDASVRRQRVDYRISIEDAFTSTWLPTPYPVTEIDVPGDWRYDVDTLDIVSAEEGQGAAGLSYSLTALELAPTAQDLADAGAAPEAIFTPNTDLPDDLPVMVGDLAREVTAGLSSRFEKAVRLQRWFREDGGFEYSLDRDAGNGSDDLVAFLSAGPGGRIGYCEQFAASMALMGRSLGIPSRVAVGFLRPDQVADGDYVYSSHDLHAWPEMYFDDTGWVRFEPTPQRASDVPGYTSADLGGPDPTDLPSAAAPTTTPDDLERREPDQGEGALAAGDEGGGGTGTWPGILAGLAFAGVLIAPRLTRAGVRRRRWATAERSGEVAEAGWRELRDTALDLRLGWDDTVTLRTQARRLADSFGAPDAVSADAGLARGRASGAAADPDAAHALERLVRGVEQTRYSRTARTSPSAGEVGHDVDRVADALRAGATKRARRSAVWLPASLVRNGAWRSVLPRRSVGTSPLAEAGMDRPS